MGASQTSSDEVAQRLGTSPPPPRDDDGGDNLAPGGVRQAKDEAVADHAGGPDLVEYLTGGDLEPPELMTSSMRPSMTRRPLCQCPRSWVASHGPTGPSSR